MKKITNSLPLFGALVLLLGCTALASAQRTGSSGRNNRDDRRPRADRSQDIYRDDNDRRDDDYDRDDDSNRNGNYTRNGNYNSNDLRNSVRRVKDLSKNFQKHLDSALDRSRYDDRNSEDRINDVAKDFRAAASRLEDRFDNGRDTNRSANEARELLQLGQQLDRFMGRNQLDSQTESEWNEITRHLHVIADGYGYNFNEGGRKGNGRYGRNDDSTNRRDDNRANRRNRNGNGRGNGNRGQGNGNGNGNGRGNGFPF